MEQADRALGLLSIARKGGNIQLGEEAVGAACRENHARLILLASDAADNTARRAQNFAAGKAGVIRIPYTRETLGCAVGRAMCAVAALTDVQLARAFVQALGRPEQNAPLLADLDERVRRVRQRRKEERAHGYNVKHGKK